MQGRLTVVLDLDGTLISSFTPRRAPRLAPGVTTHLVGRGSQLNPNGVFVVERPGLQHFLQQLSSFAGVLYHAVLCFAVLLSSQTLQLKYKAVTFRSLHFRCSICDLLAVVRICHNI